MNKGEQGLATTLIAIMWLIVGGTQVLASVWGLVIWCGMLAMTLYPQVGRLPAEVRLFLLAFPIGATAQCLLGWLLFRGAIRLLHSEAQARVQLRKLSWYALGLCGSVGAAAVLLGVRVSGAAVSPDAVIGTRMLFIGMPVCFVMIIAIPPAVTLLALKDRDGRRVYPTPETSEGLSYPGGRRTMRCSGRGTARMEPRR